MSQYLFESTKTGDFNPRRTFSVSFFEIPWFLGSWFLGDSLAFGVNSFGSFGVLTFWRLGNSQKWKGDTKKWRSVATEKPEMSRYLLESTKTGDFNPQRTLSELFFVIPERLASNHSVVLAFTANKQTNKHSQLYIEILALTDYSIDQ